MNLCRHNERGNVSALPLLVTPFGAKVKEGGVISLASAAGLDVILYPAHYLIERGAR